MAKKKNRLVSTYFPVAAERAYPSCFTGFTYLHTLTDSHLHSFTISHQNMHVF